MHGSKLNKLNPDEINSALEQISIVLAEAVKDVEVRELIRDEVGKKFDGDYNALYKNLKFFRFRDGKNFEERLADAYVKVEAKRGEGVNLDKAILRIKNFVGKIPRFQISIPVNFEKWDVRNYTPLVAYHPVGVDDKLVKYVKAFDSSGREFMLDAWRAPEFPVIVLGVSERTDDEGNVIHRSFGVPNFRESEPGDEGGGYSGGGSSGGSNSSLPPRVDGCLEILQSLLVRDDSEPWTRGDAEIRLKITCELYPNVSIMTQLFDGYNESSEWYNDVNRNLANWHISSYGNFWIYFWYEEDVGGENKTFSIIYQGKEYGIKIGANLIDSDDELGASVVNFNDPYRKDYPYQTGKIDWYDKWVNPPFYSVNYLPK